MAVWELQASVKKPPPPHPPPFPLSVSLQLEATPMSEDATATLLLHAAKEGDTRCVRELVDADADGSLPLYKALLVAVERGHARVVRVLLDRGASANTISDEGRTVLELAAGNGHTKVVRCLIQHGADLSDAGSDVWTPLILAIENGHEETARYLVERGADVNSTDYAGRAMLSVAVDTEQEQIVRYLVNNGAGVQMPEKSAAAAEQTEVDTDLISRQGSSEGFVPWPKWRFSRWDVTVNEPTSPSASRSVSKLRGKWLGSDVVVRKAAKKVGGERSVDNTQWNELQRFKREVRRWFGLNHPHVAQLFGACCDDVLTPIYVFEYAANGPLDRFLKAHPEQLWPKMHEVALGVQYLHDRGIVLGKLKCSAIEVGSDRKAKVTEFGQRRMREDGANNTGDTQGVAPELLSNNLVPATLESDIFALGACVLEAMQIVEAEMRAEESFVVVETEEDDHQSDARGSEEWVECHATPRSAFSSLPGRPATCTDDQWGLVEEMCAQDPCQRLRIADVVRALERLTINRNGRPKLEREAIVSLGAFDNGKLNKRWSEVMHAMENRTLMGLEQRVFRDLWGIFTLLQRSEHPRSLFDEVTLLLEDFLRDDRFMRCRILNPSALRSTCSMREFDRRIHDVLRKLNSDKSHAASADYSYRQIDFLVSEDLPSWLLLGEVEPGGADEKLHSLLKAELFGNSYRYTFDQLVVIRSAYEEIGEILNNNADLLSLRPRWFVCWRELQLAGWGGSALAGHAKWLGTDVMVKRLESSHRSVKAATKATDELRQQVDVWFSLSHPNVVRLYGACHVGDRFLVCEDAPKGTLNEYLREHPEQLWRKLLEAAKGLAYLHARGIVHGHLGNGGIVVAADGVAKLTDVGVGAADGLAADETTGDEQRMDLEPTVASDIFSLGVCVTEALRAATSPVKGEEQPKAFSSSGLEAFLESDSVPSRPPSCRDSEWELIQGMCSSDPSECIGIETVVDALAALAMTEDLEAGPAMKPALNDDAYGSRKRSRTSELLLEASSDAESKRRIGSQ